MKFNLLFTLCCCMLSFSCQKDRLEGDAEILTGWWYWINTEKVTNTCDPDSLWNYSYLDSNSFSNQYSLHFRNKGKIIYYHNKDIFWKERIVFESFESIESNSYRYEFNIYLDNRKKDIMHGFVGDDSLRLDDFPKDTDDLCQKRHNHFIRK